MKIRRLIPLFTMSAAIAATLVGAQVEPMSRPETIGAPVTKPTSQRGVVTRFYDVGDLMLKSRDFLVDSSTVEKKDVFIAEWNNLEELIQTLTDNVDSDSWRANGGEQGTIRQFSKSTLVVTQSLEAHRAVEEFLGKLRGRRDTRTMISTRAAWLTLDAKDVRATFDHARKTAPADATMGPAVVDDATLDRATVYAQGQTTCFNGQTVSIASEREWSVVTNVTPIVGAGAVGYSPTTDRAKGGVTLQLTPQLSGDDASVVLDLRSVVTETRRPTTDAATTQPAIDPHDVTKQSIGTTVRLPLEQRVLVAGMTLDPSAGGDGRALYLVIEVDTVR